MPFTFRVEFLMKKPVRPDALNYAVHALRFRYPHFSMRDVRRGEEYVTEENPEPFVMWHDDGSPAPALGSEAVNGHMLFVGYRDNVINIYCSHIITDGGGSKMMLSTLMYYYVTALENTVFDPTGFTIVQDPPFPDETSDPYPTERAESATPLYRKKYENIFRLADGGHVNDRDGRVFRFTVPVDDVMSFSHDHDGSPNALFTSLMAQAVFQVHPDLDKSVIGAVSYNQRPMLGCPHNYRLLSGNLHIEYPARMKNDNILRLCTCTRGMITLQCQPENVLVEARERKELTEYIMSIPTLAEKKKFLGEKAFFDAHNCTFSVSYVGKVEYGELTAAIDRCYIATDGTIYDSAMIEISPVNDIFCVTLFHGFSNDIYYRALLDRIRACGIPVTEEGWDPLRLPGIELPE